MQRINHFHLSPVAICLCAGFTVSAQAQIMDEVDLRQEGINAIAEIKFLTPVQYTKSISARSADLVQAFYTVMPTREMLALETSERRIKGGAGLPTIIVRDESTSATAANSMNRKLVIRFDKPTRFKVRSGRSNSSIELVLEGLGNSVNAVKAAAVEPIKVQPPVAALPDLPVASGASDMEASAATLLATAQSAFDGGQYDAATDSLNQLLNLPPNKSSRQAQELAGLARLNAGDKARAASEFDLFLKLYPAGVDSDRIRQLVASLPTIGAVTLADSGAVPVAEPTSTTTGSVSMFYYGGQSTDQTRKDAFANNGLPTPQESPTAALSDQKQLQTSYDLNWRFRDTEKDMRFVVRESLTSDFVKTKDKNKERLSALYFDYKSLTLGGNVRVGRQSPTGGGVMYRFDGVQAGYSFKPKWKVNAAMGAPSDDLLDAKRSFYGVSVDAEALTKEMSGSMFLIEQRIDGEIDRRGLGADLRYFKGGVTASGQLDYDQILRKVNILAFQSTWQVTEATALNAMFDRRTSPILSLGNSLFYGGANGAQVKRIQDLLVGAVSLETLRNRITGTTPYQNQVQIGGTTTLNANWQSGGTFSLSSVDAIPDFFYDDAIVLGQAATGNQWGVSAQLIGTNLYSVRDTHVFNVSFNGTQTDHSVLLSYNNLTSLNEKWQLEPSLKYYTRSSSLSGDTDTWTAGVRGIYRVRSQVSVESELTYERSKNMNTTSSAGVTTTTESSRNGMTYYLGARLDF